MILTTKSPIYKNNLDFFYKKKYIILWRYIVIELEIWANIWDVICTLSEYVYNIYLAVFAIGKGGNQ